MLKIIHDQKFGNMRFTNADSSLPDYVVIMATFFYKGKVIQRNISLEKKSRKGSDYFSQAKTIIDSEIKSGYLEEYSIDYIKKVAHKRRILLILMVVFIAIAIALISLFTWKMVGGK